MSNNDPKTPVVEKNGNYYLQVSKKPEIYNVYRPDNSGTVHFAGNKSVEVMRGNKNNDVVKILRDAHK
ncbi:hypothetical protein [Commensalibacter nepenthis]|uniref:Uncharacterized protein n=1 Tax=Commensalibacter nepenthis TaxID=3043872 RepID=A0ABT6Q5N8_9PROT|nr:hypothetical protein [Commensalibacter sp. TBRC 10068]MDI2112208.1 hypothetical protein [Commensalibacter sp. TBRC 10068]